MKSNKNMISICVEKRQKHDNKTVEMKSKMTGLKQKG